jgi:hypothetical protein
MGILGWRTREPEQLPISWWWPDPAITHTWTCRCAQQDDGREQGDPYGVRQRPPMLPK